MGHLFVICGPPGVGKTTLLKLAREQTLPLENLRRITTREPRPEEGDGSGLSLEYDFLDDRDFAGRLSRGAVANFIEWNGRFYATDLEAVVRTPSSGKSYLLLEDIPSAVHLKHSLGSMVTVFLVFTDDVDELFRIEFATLQESRRPSVVEWRRRLSLKFAKHRGRYEDENCYVREKIHRATFDLAFITGKLRRSEDIRVLPNRRDEQQAAIDAFKNVVQEVMQNRVALEDPGKFAFVLMPFRDTFDKIYQFVIKPTVEQMGLTCLRGDEVSSDPTILSDVLRHVEAAQVIISDITTGNPNVFLELGAGLRSRRPFILLTQDERAPFDVSHFRRIQYADTLIGWEKLRRELADAIGKFQQRGVGRD